MKHTTSTSPRDGPVAAPAIATDTARATVGAALAVRDRRWWINERLDGAVVCASLHDAVLTGDRVRHAVVESGWWTDEGPGYETLEHVYQLAS